MAAFCPSPVNLPEAKLKNSGQITLPEISRQPHIVSVA